MPCLRPNHRAGPQAVRSGPATLNAGAAALGPEFNIFSSGGKVVATPPAFINFHPAQYLRPFTIP